MPTLSIILLALVIWWIAFAICVASDKMRRPKPTASAPQVQPTKLPESVQPRWPAWRECFAQPRLFFVVVGAGLIYGTCFIFIWPAFVIHTIWHKRQHDHVS